jgi:hypothetical protein
MMFLYGVSHLITANTKKYLYNFIIKLWEQISLQRLKTINLKFVKQNIQKQHIIIYYQNNVFYKSDKINNNTQNLSIQ